MMMRMWVFLFDSISSFHHQLRHAIHPAYGRLFKRCFLFLLLLSQTTGYKLLCNDSWRKDHLFCGLVGPRWLCSIMSYSSLIVSKCVTWPVSGFIRSDQQCCFVCERDSLVPCWVFLSWYLLSAHQLFIQCAHSPNSAMFHSAHYVISECDG